MIIQWSPGVTLDLVERQVILAAYEHYKHNKTSTSNAIGCSIRTLDNKLAQYKKDDESIEIEKIERAEKREKELYYARYGRPSEESHVTTIEIDTPDKKEIVKEVHS